MENNNLAEQSPEKNTDTIFTEEEFSMRGYDKHIRQARNAIFIAAGVLLLNVIILAATVPYSYEYLWLDFVIWGAFIAGFIVLGIWTKKKPYYAIVGGLILMGVFIVVNALIEPLSMLSGIIFKIAVVLFLTKGLGDANEAQQMKEEFDSH